MLNSYNDLKTYSIRAIDERTGHVDDIYFDDQTWRIRYLVVHTGFLLAGRQSLVGASRLKVPDTDKRQVPVDLTADELEAADKPEANAPVSEQERAAETEPGMAIWPSFIVGPGMGYTPALAQDQLDIAMSRDEDQERPPGDRHLRSMAEVVSYAVRATDGEIGSVTDFLIDPETWQVQHLVIDTGNWLPGRRVVITTDWIESVDWAGQSIHVNVDKNTVADAPPLQEIDDLKRSDTEEAMARYSALGYWPI